MLTERDVTEIAMKDGKLLVFRIPRASYDIRPVYLTKNPFGNTYKRNHEGDYHCTDAEVRQMFSDAHHSFIVKGWLDNQWARPLLEEKENSIPSLMTKVNEKNRSRFKQNIIDPHRSRVSRADNKR